MSRLDRRDGWAALILALGAFLLLFATEGTVAVGWDEPITTENGQRIVMWLGTFVSGLIRADLSQALDPVTVGMSFGLNNEHPPVAKTISGLGWALTRRWLPLPTAHRVGPMALAAALVVLIYVAVRQAGAGRLSALVGALALLDMPRVFFHAHVAALDLPAAAMWFFAVWVFWRLALKEVHSPSPVPIWAPWPTHRLRAGRTGWRSACPGPSPWGRHRGQGQPRNDSGVASDGTSLAGGGSSSQKTLLRMTFSLIAASLATRTTVLWLWMASGLAFGLALATKISNVLAPIGVGLWLLISRDRRWRWDLWGRLILVGPLGLLTVIALFPWLWSDTVTKLERWVRFFTVSHYEIYQYYFGKTYLELPWHFPIVTVLTTVPVSLLILAGIGATRALRPGPTQPAAALWLINTLLMVIWFMRPASRAFDSDRLLMPVYVFLAPLVGLGFDVMAWWIRQKGEAHLMHRTPRTTHHVSRFTHYVSLFTPFISLALAIIVLAPGALAIARLHPFELAYYNEAIGGVHGAQRLRLETIYWASTYRAVLPELNRRAKFGATVWVMPNSWDVLYYYQKAGLLRDDLVMARPPGWGSFYDDSGVKWVEAGMDQADFAIVEYRQTTFFDYVVDYMAQHQPVWRLDYRDIPLVALYERSG